MTPLERAANAIVDELRRQEPEHGGTYFIDAAHLDDTVIDGRFDLRAIARAVLAAIREPSYEAVIAGEAASDKKTDCEAIWQAMIDHALAEGE